jgi:hypothetical protein
MEKRTQGMNWIRKEKRLAIYLRDGMACVYCGATIETGAILTLDHIQPYSLGGGNGEKNLVTCCQRCNSVRGNRDIAEFAEKVAGYVNRGVTAKEILNYIGKQTAKGLEKYKKEAKELMTRRTSWAECLNA